MGAWCGKQSESLSAINYCFYSFRKPKSLPTQCEVGINCLIFSPKKLRLQLASKKLALFVSTAPQTCGDENVERLFFPKYGCPSSRAAKYGCPSSLERLFFPKYGCPSSRASSRVRVLVLRNMGVRVLTRARMLNVCSFQNMGVQVLCTSSASSDSQTAGGTANYSGRFVGRV